MFDAGSLLPILYPAQTLESRCSVRENFRHPTTKQVTNTPPASGNPTVRRKPMGWMTTFPDCSGVLELCSRDHAASPGIASMEKNAKNSEAPSSPRPRLLRNNFTPVLYAA